MFIGQLVFYTVSQEPAALGNSIRVKTITVRVLAEILERERQNS